MIANTAIPVWSEARDELPWLFGASATASAGAVATLVTPREAAGPARRAAIGGVAAELALTKAMERKLGFVGEVYRRGEAGRFLRKQNTVDDFIACAESLVERGYTQPALLAGMGRSAGGLS